MSTSAIFDDRVLDRLRASHPRFHETSYLFVLSALHFSLERLSEPRHLSGRELAEGVRDLALIRYGLMARTVLEYWGITTTGDLGEIVFALVDAGILIKQEEDSHADFIDVFDFEEEFTRMHTWGAAR
ncbi:MAG TPA: Minf_1886 family protein [Longimicrobiales bacterium]|nr:Minf_1886 family protein [Longimicrobiales bacterium]